MEIVTILVVGIPPSLPTCNHADKACKLSFATSTQEALRHFKAGDFDVVLLSQSLTLKSKERMAFLIRATGSQVPLVCILHAEGDRHPFADATFPSSAPTMLASIRQAVVRKANKSFLAWEGVSS